MTGQAEQKSLDTPDETRTFERGALQLVRISGGEIGRLTLQPGWRWSQHVKPLAGTDILDRAEELGSKVLEDVQAADFLHGLQPQPPRNRRGRRR